MDVPPIGGSPSIALVETTVVAKGVLSPSSPGVEADSGAERNGGADEHLEHSRFGAWFDVSFVGTEIFRHIFVNDI